jgi:hypothetical protein
MGKDFVVWVNSQNIDEFIIDICTQKNPKVKLNKITFKLGRVRSRSYYEKKMKNSLFIHLDSNTFIFEFSIFLNMFLKAIDIEYRMNAIHRHMHQKNPKVSDWVWVFNILSISVLGLDISQIFCKCELDNLKLQKKFNFLVWI